MGRKKKEKLEAEEEVSEEAEEEAEKKDTRKYFITDPDNADRVLEVLGKKFVFTANAVEKVEVTKKEADALVAKYPYLVVVSE